MLNNNIFVKYWCECRPWSVK